MLIGDVYLAMFHSENHVNGNWLRTYWFGAYTFSGRIHFFHTYESNMYVCDVRIIIFHFNILPQPILRFESWRHLLCRLYTISSTKAPGTH